MALGIYDDTGSLLFENTTPRDLKASAYLLEQGARLSILADYLRRPLTKDQTAIFQQLLDNGRIERINGLSIYFSYADYPEYIGGMALLAHRIADLEKAEARFLILKMKNRIFLIGRAASDKVDVNIIMRSFGGAGHRRAASAVIKDGTIETVLDKLRKEIQDTVKKPYLVKDIMSYPVKTVFAETTMEEVSEVLLKYGHTGVPVVEGNKLVGIISRRDVDKALKHGLMHAPVKGFMSRELVVVKPEDTWEEVQRLMVLHDIGRLPVLDNGELVGIVSRSDILSQLYQRVIPTAAELARQRSVARKKEVLKKIQKLPPVLQSLLGKIKEQAVHSSSAVYLVGGFVRDLLLDIPCTDLDIVVEGDSFAFAESLKAELQPIKYTVHKSYGTAQLELEGGICIDIASSRREDYDYPGALPRVEMSTLKDDLFRRDFTINTLALCLGEDCFAEIIDYYGGWRDLQQRLIRILHNLSFIDDPTRMMRAIRFAGKYGFKLTRMTSEAISMALETDALRKVSVERFTEELILIYSEPQYRIMGRMLIEMGIFKNWFGEDWAWDFSGSGNADCLPLEKRWLASIKNIDYNGIIKILDRLRLNKHLHKLTTDYLRVREKLPGVIHSLREIDALLADQPQVLLEVLAEHEKFAPALEKYRAGLKTMNMKVTGTDIINAGLKQGPLVGDLLREIRGLWLEGQIKSRAEENKYLKERIKQLKS